MIIQNGQNRNLAICNARQVAMLRGGQWIIKPWPLSSAVKSQIYTEYAANPTLAAQIWKAANVYAKANPTTIPIINAHPKAYHACIDYVTDGLVFQMDCDWLCTAAQWQDRIGNIIFAGTNVQLQDGIPYFNGTNARYDVAELTSRSATSCTIEAFLITEKNAGGVYSPKTRNDICFGYSGNALYLSTNSGINYAFVADSKFNSRVSMHKDKLCIDGVATSKTRIGGYQESNTNSIGYSKDFGYMKGRIMAIRIYDRLLTEQEMLANQTADLFRWNS